MIKLKSLLKEILNAKNFWMYPDGKIEDVKDHLTWAIENIKLPYDFDGDGYPINNNGSIVETEDVYNEIEKLGYVRVVKEMESDFLMFNYHPSKPPTNVQIRSLKNFAIENHWSLYDDNNRKEIELV